MEIIEKLLQTKRTNEEKANYLREFLQVLLLKTLNSNGYFKNLSFVGGTALRLFYDLRRFSEDLDFSLFDKKGYHFERLTKSLFRDLTDYGFQLDITATMSKTVQSIDLRFKGLLYQLHLSPIKTQKLFIRLEIDTNPPKGWQTQISLINRTFVFTVTHFDLPSLYALKLHACFYRKYTKGRDFYDLVWYLGKKINPNYKLLNNAIKQTEKIYLDVSERNFRNFLKKKIEKVDFQKIKRDVERFLEDKSELAIFDKELVLNLVKET